MTMYRRRTTIVNILVFLSLVAFAMAPPWLGVIEGQPTRPTTGKAVPDRPLLLFGLWGFGDFQGKPCPAEDGGRVIPVPRGHRMGTWSGCSKKWDDNGLDIRSYNTLVVQAEGVGTIRFSDHHDQKMMKWFVQWPGQMNDEALICTESDLRASSDREWVVPVEGRFEYRLPEGAVRVGKLTKIGFTFLEGATYGNVRLRAWLASQ